jgi:nitrogen regulatory protein PII-like uncharacterized protein
MAGATGYFMMHLRQISPWQWATLITGFLAVIAISAVALMLGKDALITIAAVLAMALLGIAWLVSG